MQEKMAQMHAALQYLRQRYPTETQAFSHFFQKTESGTALSLKYKELINVALAVASLRLVYRRARQKRGRRGRHPG